MFRPGYDGKQGELWYARVLPPPLGPQREHVVFTTPYILLKQGPRDWLAYFSRALPAAASAGDYRLHMKFGPARDYWNEFVFEAYVNYRTEAIFLTGVPDLPAPRPHSKENELGGAFDPTKKHLSKVR